MSIKGTVAKIIDETSLVISIGEKSGVTQGMRFVVYEEGQDIRDPESGESLGKLEVVKAEVQAVHVQENMTLLKSLPTEQPQGATVLSARLQEGGAGIRNSAESSRQKLYVRQGDISGVSKVSPISVGDLVRSI